MSTITDRTYELATIVGDNAAEVASIVADESSQLASSLAGQFPKIAATAAVETAAFVARTVSRRVLVAVAIAAAGGALVAARRRKRSSNEGDSSYGNPRPTGPDSARQSVAEDDDGPTPGLVAKSSIGNGTGAARPEQPTSNV